MNLELYKEKNNVLHYYEGKALPIASIYRSGHIAINKAASIKYSLPKFRFVEIYYDKETQDIGLKFLENRTEHSYVGRYDSRYGKTHHRGYQFQCKSFLTIIGYEKKYVARFELLENEEVYVFNLNRPLGGHNHIANSMKPKIRKVLKKCSWFKKSLSSKYDKVH